MNTKNFIEGITLLQSYRSNQDDYYLHAENDIIYIHPTDARIITSDVNKLLNLGWYQEHFTGEEETWAEQYNPKEGWVAYV